MRKAAAHLHCTFAIAIAVYQRHRLDQTGRCVFCGHCACCAQSHAAQYIRGVGVDPAEYDTAVPADSTVGVDPLSASPPRRRAPYAPAGSGDQRPQHRPESATGADAPWPVAAFTQARPPVTPPPKPPLAHRVPANADLAGAGNYRVTATAAVPEPAAWAISSRDFPIASPTDRRPQ